MIINKWYYICLFLLLTVPYIQSQQTIDVGITINQPPLIMDNMTGIGPDLIHALNNVQNDYYFRIIEQPPKRGLINFNSGKISIMVLVNIDWSYDKTICKQSIPIIKVQDKYFTINDHNIHEDLINRVGIDKTSIVNGFHYSFTNFDTDLERLNRNFNLIVVKDEPSVINMVLKERAVFGVVSSLLLEYLSVTSPKEFSKLFIFKKSDTEYYRHFIVRNDAKITVEQLNIYLEELFSNGMINNINSKYGLNRVTKQFVP